MRLTLAKRIVLTTASVAALAVPLVTGAIDAAALSAGQLPGVVPAGLPVDPETRFEVASIKSFEPSGTFRVSTTPGRLDAAGLPLHLLFAQALAVPVDRIIGLPDWVNKERYTIAAKAPDGAPPNAMPVMVANLLKDRFKLATHRETRELPVYNLVFARNDKRLGPAFKETSAECRTMISARLEASQRGGPVPAAPPDPNGCLSSLINPRFSPGIASFKGALMAMIATILAQQVGRPVIDKTGLTSVYDFTLKWTPQPGSGGLTPFGQPLGGPPDAVPTADPDTPNLFTAVQEQLGLKLESARGPVEVLVIDSLEKPTPD